MIGSAGVDWKDTGLVSAVTKSLAKVFEDVYFQKGLTHPVCDRKVLQVQPRNQPPHQVNGY